MPSTWFDVVPGLEGAHLLVVAVGQSLPWISPPMHLMAQAVMMPSGVPPMPMSMSTELESWAAAMAPATSPSEMRRTLAPARECQR